MPDAAEPGCYSCSWLQALEAIDGTLQPEHAELRNRWEHAARH